jgi:hypothetical protein
MKIRLMLLALILLTYACNDGKSPIKQDNLTRIVFATGYCHGECPQQAIEIDSSLAYKYYGGEFARNKGYFRGTIGKGFWESLDADLKKPEFLSLNNIYDDSVDDQSVEVIIYRGKSKKHIRGQYESLPNELRHLFATMNSSINLANLKPISDTIHFESTIQMRVSKIAEPRFPPKSSEAADSD